MRTAVYQLKRTFGKPARVRLVGRAVNRETGDVTETVEEIEIQRLVQLPHRLHWSAGPSVSITEVNAAYQQGDKEFLLDTRDFTSTYTMKHDIVIGDTVYRTVSFTVYPECIYILGRNEHSP